MEGRGGVRLRVRASVRIRVGKFCNSTTHTDQVEPIVMFI